MYGARMRYRHLGLKPYCKPASTKAGTMIAGGVTEAQIKAGGQVLTHTLTDGIFNKNSAAFNAARQAFIDGMDSAQAEAGGWDAKIKADEVVGSVVRTSGGVLTWTNTAHAGYATTADETITAEIPAAALEAQFEPLAAGTFVVTTD
jgi:hypothetical protein